MNTQEYFQQLENDVKNVYSLIGEARAKGIDPVNKVEIPLARSLAEKVVGLMSSIYPDILNVGLTERILELEKEYGKLDIAVVFKIAEEVAKGKFIKFPSQLKAIEAGIRVGFTYTTLSVVSSPIEGFTELKTNKTLDGKDYFVAYFSGPIRSAGTTASCVVLMLIDYLREMFGYAKYDPTPEEIKRCVTENIDYHERITNLQYFPTEEEMTFLATNIPIQIAGDPTEKIEVSNYKNLKRVETNFIRGGMCLIFSEGLAQKAAKGFRLLKSVKEKGFTSTGFDFLKDYIELHKRREIGKTDSSPTYLNDLVAGRPVFGHPSMSGGFRFRYGRSRVSGFSATSMNPATMAITDSFIAIGTQLKIEKPTKGCVVTPCDDVDGPIVKLFSGSVKKLKTKEEAKKYYSDTEEIIYLGDILFSFGDLSNRNYDLIKPGYVEEWWSLELREKGYLEKINPFDVSLEKAIELSRKHKISLHPKFIFYWTEISKEELVGLVEWLMNSKTEGKIILPYNKQEQEKYKLGKRALELLGVEHEVVIEHVILTEENSKALLTNLGIDFNMLNEKDKTLNNFIGVEKFSKEGKVLEIINSLSMFEIKDKAGDFIGARMGRPEKAKLRKLIGSPNILFPVGNEGGKFRNLNAAREVGKIRSSFPIYYCNNCNKETIFSLCESCSSPTRSKYYCPKCENSFFQPCSEHNISFSYRTQTIDINHYFDKTIEKIGIKKGDIPQLIKGVRGTSSGSHKLEHLAKGILRAMYDLQVNKDGTIRFDATELPIIAFKPKEIFTSVEKLKELGYDKDIYGKDLIDKEQILELKPHDVILPSCSESGDEKADDVLVKICNFVDSLLLRLYKMNKFHNVKKREDLVGQLGVCMAPHNCAGVICRFIGFSNTQGLFASPYMHAAMRRDCDGDEAAVMLLTDVLLNFSFEFLPKHRGGTQDAPLVLNAKISAGEVDDQIMDFEMTYEYPLELYRSAELRKHSSEIRINNVKTAVKEGKDTFVGVGFTHNTSNINDGILCSSYKSLLTMQDKLQHQMNLVEKIRAVNTADTARLVIDKHFIKDLRGNLRKFSTQTFRCVECNEILRRIPLNGVCTVCGGKLIFTVNEGGIKKYLEPAIDLVEKYKPSDYMRQNLELIKRHIESIFGKETEKQEALKKWF